LASPFLIEGFDRRCQSLELAKSRRGFAQVLDRNPYPALGRGIIPKGKIVSRMPSLNRGYA
jgi:hypothetical protein